ncbi:hypothetical protein KI387_023240, partial [Taxus chinensis]
PNKEVLDKSVKASSDLPFETTVKEDFVKVSMEVNEHDGSVMDNLIRNEACNKEVMTEIEPLEILSSGEN